MTDEQISKMALEAGLGDSHGHLVRYYSKEVEAFAQLVRNAALAEPAVEAVGWEWRWFDANPNTVTFGQWSEWKRVEPRNRLCTVDDSLNEFRAYIANGYRYELRALFTSPPPPAKVPLLTDDEIDDVWLSAREANEYPIGVFARSIEALVRQKAGL